MPHYKGGLISEVNCKLGQFVTGWPLFRGGLHTYFSKVLKVFVYSEFTVLLLQISWLWFDSSGREYHWRDACRRKLHLFLCDHAHFCGNEGEGWRRDRGRRAASNTAGKCGQGGSISAP